MTIEATDQSGETYQLSLAVGDNVRLFNMTRASFEDGRGGAIGWNGSVVPILGLTKDGFRARSSNGRVGFGKWDTIRDEVTAASA